MNTCNIESENSRCNKEHPESLHLASSAYCQTAVATETHSSTKPRKACDVKQQLGTGVLKSSMNKLLAAYKV